MRTQERVQDHDELTRVSPLETRVLPTAEERQVLREMADCKRKLTEALGAIPGADVPDGGDDPHAFSQYISTFYAGDGPTEARLGAIVRRYSELRGKLAMANMRLVAHVAKKFRDRGIPYSDLLQEGFCGLLEAIDRFDLNHETKLATYATWWIRQAMQRAVASGAYPVKLSPRHLRQLAQSQGELDLGPGPIVSDPEGDVPIAASTQLIQRIHTATRPTLSLNATADGESRFSLLDMISEPDGDATETVDMDETVSRLMEMLRPREQEVLALRFGLSGKPRLSLSQVGKVLSVSKERVRQIQDRALEKLRDAAEDFHLADLMPGAV